MARATSTPDPLALADRILDDAVAGSLARHLTADDVERMIPLQRGDVSIILTDLVQGRPVDLSRADLTTASVTGLHENSVSHGNTPAILSAERAAPMLRRLGSPVANGAPDVPIFPNDPAVPGVPADSSELTSLGSSTMSVTRDGEGWFRCGRVLDVSGRIAEFADPDHVELWLRREAARSIEATIADRLVAQASTPGAAGVAAALDELTSPYVASMIVGRPGSLLGLDPERLIASGIELVASPLGPVEPIALDPSAVAVQVTPAQVLAKTRPELVGVDLAAVSFAHITIQPGGAATIT